VALGVDDESAFEVEVDGVLIFSKRKEGRFPLYDDMLRAIEANMK